MPGLDGSRDRSIIASVVNERRVIGYPTYKYWVVKFSKDNEGHAYLENPWWSGLDPDSDMPLGNYKIQISFAMYQHSRSNEAQMVLDGRDRSRKGSGDAVVNENDGRFYTMEEYSSSLYGEIETDGVYHTTNILNDWQYSYHLYRNNKNAVTSDRYVQRVGCDYDGNLKFDGHIASLTLNDQADTENCRSYFFIVDSKINPGKAVGNVPGLDRIFNVLDTETDPTKRTTDFILRGYDNLEDAWAELPPGLFEEIPLPPKDSVGGEHPPTIEGGE